MRIVHLDFNESSALVADDILLFWKKARIPSKYHCDIVRILKKLYDNWHSLEKNKSRNSLTQQTNENLYKNI